MTTPKQLICCGSLLFFMSVLVYVCTDYINIYKKLDPLIATKILIRKAEDRP